MEKKFHLAIGFFVYSYAYGAHMDPECICSYVHRSFTERTEFWEVSEAWLKKV